MAASHASSSGNRPRRPRRNRDGDGEPSTTRHTTPFDEEMDPPPPRPEPEERENVMCAKALASYQEHPPFHNRRGLATIRPRHVDTYGAARLFCDGLHEGPHQWPHVYEPLIAAVYEDALSRDSVDKSEILPE